MVNSRAACSSWAGDTPVAPPGRHRGIHDRPSASSDEILWHLQGLVKKHRMAFGGAIRGLRKMFFEKNMSLHLLLIQVLMLWDALL